MTYIPGPASSAAVLIALERYLESDELPPILLRNGTPVQVEDVAAAVAFALDRIDPGVASQVTRDILAFLQAVSNMSGNANTVRIALQDATEQVA